MLLPLLSLPFCRSPPHISACALIPALPVTPSPPVLTKPVSVMSPLSAQPVPLCFPFFLFIADRLPVCLSVSERGSMDRGNARSGATGAGVCHNVLFSPTGGLTPPPLLVPLSISALLPGSTFLHFPHPPLFPSAPSRTSTLSLPFILESTGTESNALNLLGQIQRLVRLVFLLVILVGKHPGNAITIDLTRGRR